MHEWLTTVLGAGLIKLYKSLIDRAEKFLQESVNEEPKFEARCSCRLHKIMVFHCFCAPLATVEVAVETAKDGPLKPEEPLSSGCL